MPQETTAAYCHHCRTQTAHVANTPNHLVHALITLFLCGIWLPVWAVICLLPTHWNCTRCGSKWDGYRPTSGFAKVFFAGTLLALVAAAAGGWWLYENAMQSPERRPPQRERERRSGVNNEEVTEPESSSDFEYTPVPLEQPADPFNARAFPRHESAADKEWRLFMSADGEFFMEAKLLGFQNGKAQLKRRDNGTAVEVLTSKLSAEDREWIRDEIKRRNTPSP